MNLFASPALVLVLWGAGCDEAMAAGFVAAFRQQGTNVTVVGISGRHNSGAHGLTLQPDLPLGEALALADEAAFVVIPCGAEAYHRLNADPRLADLLHGAKRNGAGFFVLDAKIAALLAIDAGQTFLLTSQHTFSQFIQDLTVDTGA